MKIWALLMTLLIGPAAAHDQQMRESLYADWMKDLTSKKGLCCTQNEGATVKDVDWMVADDTRNVVCRPFDADVQNGEIGHYCVRLNGTWWLVSDKAVITESNKFGPAVVWPIWNDGSHQQLIGIRCFMPGSLS